MEFALIILHQTVMPQGPEMEQSERPKPDPLLFAFAERCARGFNPVVKEIACRGIHSGITSQTNHAQAR
jgi:hypothetical protein